MNMVESQVMDTSLFAEFLEEERRIRTLRTTLVANGQTESAQRLSRLELSLGRVRERLVELSESTTSAELLVAYEAIIDLIGVIDEILDQWSVFASLSESVPLVG